MSHVYEVGPCCLGKRCFHPDGELRSTHKCSKFNEIVHLLCAIINPESEVWMYKECKNEDTYEECSDTESEVESLTKDANNTKPVTYKDKSVIEKMTVSVQPMIKEFTTITESIKEKK